MIVAIFPSGAQFTLTRDEAERLCQQATVTSVKAHRIVLDGGDIGRCALVTALGGGYDLREFAHERGIRVAK